jgi:hypothetical protein
VLAVIVAFEVYGNRITTISQSVNESSQKYHKWRSVSYTFLEINKDNNERNVGAKRGSGWQITSPAKADFPSPGEGKGSQLAYW